MPVFIQTNVRVFIFTYKPFQPNAGLPRGGVRKHFVLRDLWSTICVRH